MASAAWERHWQRQRREQARLAGKASGRRRRQLARARRGNVGPGQRDLQLCYEPRQLSRREYEKTYESLHPRPEWPAAALQWERRLEAVWQAQKAVYALICKRGQHCRTTNGQRGVALSSRGLPRVRRSIQRYHRELEALGIATVSHLRKPQGQKDCLVIEWRIHRRLRKLPVTPPSGTVNYRLRRSSSPPCRQVVPPPSAADRDPPDEPAERPGTEKEQVEALIRFQQLRLEMGFGDPIEARAKITQLATQGLGASRRPLSGSGDRHSDP